MLATTRHGFDAPGVAPQSAVSGDAVLESRVMDAVTSQEARPRRLVAWVGFVLAISALGYLGNAQDTQSSQDLAYEPWAAPAAVAQFGVFLGVVLLLSWGVPKESAFALRRPPSWPRAIGLVAACWVAIMVLGAALLPFLDAREEQGLVPDEWDSSRAGAYLAFSAAAVLVAPVVEELIFRGLGFGLLAPYGTRTAVLGTGVLFGLWHGLLIAFPILAAFGILLGYLRARTNSVYPCMLLHAVFNGIALASVPLSG